MYTIEDSRKIACLLIAALGILAGVTPAVLAEEAPAKPEKKATLLKSQTPRDIAQLRDMQRRVREVVRQARFATVAIEQDDSIGSGVIISPEGLILTAGHVCVEPNRKVWIRFADDTRVRGVTLGVNHPVDSGMAKITADPPTDEGWPHMELAEDTATPGEWVVALGQPNGFIEGRAPPVRLGRVLMRDPVSINTDAALVGGDSGGPLINLQSQVLGIHSRIGERITSNFHVPVVAYRSEWDRLVAGRMTGVPDGDDPENSRSLAGFAVRFVDGECIVTQVFPNGAAEQAGIEPGDRIVSVAGHRPAGLHSLARHMNRQEAYDRVPVVYSRGDQTLEGELWLGRGLRPYPGSKPAPLGKTPLAKEGR